MPGYAIFIVEAVRDAALLEQYRVAGRASVVAQGGKPKVIANSRKQVVEGGGIDNLIIIEFPTLDAARTWFESPEYRAASELRKRACTCRVILTETL